MAAPALDGVTLVFFVCAAIGAYVATKRSLLTVLPILILADPFALTRYAGTTTITTFKAALLGICIALIVRRDLTWPRHGIVRWTLLCLLAVVVANALTLPEATFRAAALRETLKSLEYALVFFIAANVVQREPRAVHAAVISAAVAIVAVAISALSDFDQLQSGVWIDGRAYVRLAGALEGPNQLAAWLGIMLPTVAVMEGAAVTATILLGCGLLTFTLSRSGSAQALGALAVVAVTNSQSARRAIVIGFFAFALAIGAFVMVSHSNAPFSRMSSFASGRDEGSEGSRAILWTAAVAMFKAHPVLGVGAGNFELLLPQFGVPPKIRTHANSLYLEALADGGIVLGLATLLAALVPPIMLLRASRHPFTFAAGVIGCALALHGIFDDVTFFTKVGQCWWLVAGVAAGLVAVGAQDGALPAPRAQPAARILETEHPAPV